MGLCDPVHLAQLLHQVGLVLHPACRVYDHDILTAGFGAFHGIPGDGSRVAAALAAYAANREPLRMGR